jgi:tRNA A37 threonylcarbamoyladenosine dehydratase
MGAALKTDPGRVKVAEFWKVTGCPLAAALRTKIKKQGGVSKKFLCVYSDEIYPNKGEQTALDPSVYSSVASDQASTWNSKKVRLNGTSSYMPAIFGLTLTSLVAKTLDQPATNLSAKQ